MKLLTVENYCERHRMEHFQLFYMAWKFYHGEPTHTACQSLEKDFGLWQDTRAQPQYVLQYIKEE